MKGKVLILDDDPKIGRLLKFKLSKADYHAEYFSSGADALKEIPRMKPHIIVSDIEMPQMSGYEFCEKLRQDSRMANIPFIFLSGRTDASDQLEGFRLGADDYVCKPVKIDFLLERMEKVLARAQKAKSFQSQADFSGNLSQMNLNDVIQIVESNQKSGELEFSWDGKAIGKILFRKGNLVKAQFGVLEGAEAFYGLMDEEEGFFEFFGRQVDEPEQIRMTNMGALLQGSRLIDEAKSLYSTFPDLSVGLTVRGSVPDDVEDRFGKERIVKILSMVERGNTIDQVINSGKMSRPRAAAIINELVNLNIFLEKIGDDGGSEAEDAQKKEKSRLKIEEWLLKVLQNIEVKKTTGILVIDKRHEKQSIFVDKGRIVHAFHGNATGKKALYRIFADRGGAPKFISQPVVVAVTIEDGLEELIEDGNREVDTLKDLRKASFNNPIRVNHENIEKISRIKSRPGLKDVLTLVLQHGRVRDVIDASPLTDLRTYNHLLTMVKLGVIEIEKAV